MKTTTFLKIGKYGRPIFWAYLMTISSYYIFQIFSKGISFWFSFRGSGFLFLFFAIIVLLTILAFAVYRVSHPYVSKDGFDNYDEHWAIGLCILIPVIVIQFLLQYFFHFDFLGYILNSDPNNLMI